MFSPPTRPHNQSYVGGRYVSLLLLASAIDLQLETSLTNIICVRMDSNMSARIHLASTPNGCIYVFALPGIFFDDHDDAEEDAVCWRPCVLGQ